MKTINIFLDGEDTVINIMPKFNPDNLKESVREIIDEILDEEETFEDVMNDEVPPAICDLPPQGEPTVAICDKGKSNPEIEYLLPGENPLD
jgi:hypothetical protein